MGEDGCGNDITEMDVSDMSRAKMSKREEGPTVLRDPRREHSSTVAVGALALDLGDGGVVADSLGKDEADVELEEGGEEDPDV